MSDNAVTVIMVVGLLAWSFGVMWLAVWALVCRPDKAREER